MDIHQNCPLNDMQWISRDLNSMADDRIKFTDIISRIVFNALGELWGPHTSGHRLACSQKVLPWH